MDAHVQSISAPLIPLHGCYENETHLLQTECSFDSAFQYVFNIFYCTNLHVSYTKKHYQGDNNINRNPLDLYQVHYDIQNTDGFWWWNRQSDLSHENLDSFIVCILPRWNLAIHTVSPKLEYYWSNWWPIYSVSWVSLDWKTSGLKLILF